MSVVLVAGGAGFLGSAVAKRLLATGEGVVFLDSFEDGEDGSALEEERVAALSRHPRASVVRGDGTDPAVLEAAFTAYRPAAVVNAMRLAPGGRGVAPLLQAARAAGAGILVHLSDGRLYGPQGDSAPAAREDEAIDPGDDPELLAKAADEQVLLASGLPFVNLRVFCAVGPGGGAGRFPQDALEALLRDQEVVLADDAPRDYVHVDDVVRGVLLALERRPLGQTVNLGFGLAVRPTHLVLALAKRAGREACIVTTGDDARPPRIADLGRAWELLGFAPQLGIGDVAWGIVRARLYGEEAGRAPRPAVEAPAAEAPKPVSRRELFSFLRKPFDAAAKTTRE
jgi:nucleoside-diphosphate-sugar epimerase